MITISRSLKKKDMIYLSVEYLDSIQIVKKYHHHYELNSWFTFKDRSSLKIFFPKIDDITNYEKFRMNE